MTAAMTTHITTGVMLGRFLPPHAGHVFLAETALELVDRLTIIVCALPGDPIALPLREAWLRALFPTATVVGRMLNALPAEGAAGVSQWAAIVRAAHPAAIDRLFTAKPYGTKLAMELGAFASVIDPERATVPVDSAAVLANPYAHWPALPPVVRPHYARTICLHGPESTGKSTVAPLLARHFETLFVPEYGRTYCESFGLALTMEDLLAIGRSHCAIAQSALRQCNRRLILDTDPLMTAVWADMLFGHRDPWFETFDHTADLYLLFDIDMPWIDDGTRFFGDPARRQRFMDLSREELERRGLAYAVVSGRAPQRFDRALEAIEAAGLGSTLG